ncbi:hypothetical protein Nepgr_020694 [Nepenthes gracilis]|uniref:RNA polymerase II transcription factor B subunit 2 n=1 Tax=Nepenthes gracilis TaxID=150966 RepID=A0AAD3XVG1_NEPGR|nr:hypothetical protein Nepgr_020694 [Nepenthes gracilis]
MREGGVDPVDLISFMLELSFHETGQIITVKDLANLGLVKLQQGRKDGWFIPTKLVTNLSVSLSDSTTRKQGFVVVETNFRMYAYSSSKLHCEILRLFSRYYWTWMLLDINHLFLLLPTLQITLHCDKMQLCGTFLFLRSSICYTLCQIISFLQQNAHPRVAERMPSVPENVTDQIRLWEADLNRVEMTPAHLYEEFPSKDVFDSACDFARDHGGVLWEDSKTMQLVVKADIHNHIREYLRQQK